MSKKKNYYNQQVISIGTLALVFVVSTIFYFIDTNFNGGNEPPESHIIYNNESNISESNVDIKKYNTDGLSEIQDLHDSLKAELNISNELNLSIVQKLDNESNESNKSQYINIAIPEEDDIKDKNNYKYGNIKDPKLVIIIDDIAFQYQIDMFKKLNLSITLSMFPADGNHPSTPKYAQKESVKMVHLPMEAVKFSDEEEDTLHVSDSNLQIAERVAEIVKQFPNLKYMNNHTGSKFTSDKRAMQVLLSNLKKYNIQFVDSVTSARTVVKKVSSELGLRYIKRDIFIDNELDVSYSVRQLKIAIELARKNGLAVAIGHPHKTTYQAISKIKPLLNGVKIVYINEI